MGIDTDERIAYLVMPVKATPSGEAHVWELQTAIPDWYVNTKRGIFGPKYGSLIAESVADCSRMEWVRNGASAYKEGGGKGRGIATQLKTHEKSVPGSVAEALTYLVCAYMGETLQVAGTNEKGCTLL